MLSAYEFSEHACDMMRERNIRESWVELTVKDAERTEFRDDGTIHYIRAIDEYGGRYFRVVVNPNVTPRRIVTLFFNRRVRRNAQ